MIGKQLIAEIKKYDKIIIFRHSHPDGDALGSQWGLYKWIKLNFSHKEVICVGENPEGNLSKIFPKSHNENSFKINGALGIICDTANTERIDSDLWVELEKTIKIDHHPNDDHYADVELADIQYSATSEILADVFLNSRIYEMDKEIAKFLYLGIVTDTGRFLHPNTSQRTLLIVSKLIGYNFNRVKLLSSLYQRNIDEIRFGAYVQSNMILDNKPTIYAVVPKGIEKKFKLPYGVVSSYVFSLKNVNGYPYQVYASYDITINKWRVSLRSTKKPIDEIARKYGGGGHPLASGVRLNTKAKVLELINDVSKLK